VSVRNFDWLPFILSDRLLQSFMIHAPAASLVTCRHKQPGLFTWCSDWDDNAGVSDHDPIAKVFKNQISTGYIIRSVRFYQNHENRTG
jgi:hypothetical protein